MEAGKDEYYMYTSFERDADGLYTFESRMQRTICQPEIPCPERLRIVIRDYQLSEEGSEVDPEISFPIGRYPFAENLTLPAAAYIVSFTAEGPEDSDLSYNWDFGDGNSASGADPSHEYLNRDAYEVCLEIANANGESSKICNELSMREGVCQANFSHELLPQFGNYVQYRSSSVGDIPIKYNWDFGDGIQATLSNPGYFYAEKGIYQTCLSVVDKNGCRSRLCKNIPANSDDLASSFTYSVAEQAIPVDTLQLGAVSVSVKFGPTAPASFIVQTAFARTGKAISKCSLPSPGKPTKMKSRPIVCASVQTASSAAMDKPVI